MNQNHQHDVQLRNNKTIEKKSLDTILILYSPLFHLKQYDAFVALQYSVINYAAECRFIMIRTLSSSKNYTVLR